MILVDIGNSGLRASRVADGHLFRNDKVFRLSWAAALASPRKPSPEQEAAPDQKWCKLEDGSAFDWLVTQFHPLSNEPWLVSCVQRHALAQLRTSLDKLRFGTPTRVISHFDIPMVIDVESPEKTGVDRLLAAFSAQRHANERESTPQPVIVIQAGTAVTVDFVDASGVFRGGSIMPGLGLSLQLLAAGTDLLPWLGNHAVDVRPTLPGKNTEQAISAGVNAALVGGASHLVERYRSESLFKSSVKVILSGGDGRLLLPHIEKPAEFLEHLVLRGLSQIGSPAP
jgi:type III pantothenate kinase